MVPSLKKIIIFAWAMVLPLAAKAEISHLELGAANYSAADGSDPKRFRTLERTVRRLIKVYGNSGTIYLNDIDPSGLDLCERHLSNWLASRAYHNIRLVKLPGDYFEIELPPGLKTAQLNHPSYNQLDGENLEKLRKIAARSENGLIVVSQLMREILSGAGRSFEAPPPPKRDWVVDTGKFSDAYYFGDGTMQGYRHKVYVIKGEALACRDVFH